MEIKLAETETELLQILTLQKENHVSLISPDVKKTEGFVTVKHDLNLLNTMNDLARQVIAVENGQVIAYALVMVKELKMDIPVLTPMFDMFKEINYKGGRLSDANFYVMGQVCVDKRYRGKGVFEMLYAKHREVYQSRFDLCITEVSSSNPRSMRAHEKVGFKTIHTFSDKTDEWNILTWDWN